MCELSDICTFYEQSYSQHEQFDLALSPLYSAWFSPSLKLLPAGFLRALKFNA